MNMFRDMNVMPPIFFILELLVDVSESNFTPRPLYRLKIVSGTL